MKRFILCLTLFSICSCKNTTVVNPVTSANSDTITVKDFREFKVLDSKYIDVSYLWKPFNHALENFTEDEYNRLKPLVLEQDIPTLQKNIIEGKLSYETLTKFYLFRIRFK